MHKQFIWVSEVVTAALLLFNGCATTPDETGNLKS